MPRPWRPSDALRQRWLDGRDWSWEWSWRWDWRWRQGLHRHWNRHRALHPKGGHQWDAAHRSGDHRHDRRSCAKPPWRLPSYLFLPFYCASFAALTRTRVSPCRTTGRRPGHLRHEHREDAADGPNLGWQLNHLAHEHRWTASEGAAQCHQLNHLMH